MFFLNVIGSNKKTVSKAKEIAEKGLLEVSMTKDTIQGIVKSLSGEGSHICSINKYGDTNCGCTGFLKVKTFCSHLIATLFYVKSKDIDPKEYLKAFLRFPVAAKIGMYTENPSGILWIAIAIVNNTPTSTECMAPAKVANPSGKL